MSYFEIKFLQQGMLPIKGNFVSGALISEIFITILIISRLSILKCLQVNLCILSYLFQEIQETQLEIEELQNEIKSLEEQV